MLGQRLAGALLHAALAVSFPLCAHARTSLLEENRCDCVWAGNHRAASCLIRPHHSRRPHVLTGGRSLAGMLRSSSLSLGCRAGVSQGSGKVELSAGQLSVGTARNADCRPKPRPTESETLGVQPGSLCFNKPSRQLRCTPQRGMPRRPPSLFPASSLTTAHTLAQPSCVAHTPPSAGTSSYLFPASGLQVTLRHPRCPTQHLTSLPFTALFFHVRLSLPGLYVYFPNTKQLKPLFIAHLPPSNICQLFATGNAAADKQQGPSSRRADGAVGTRGRGGLRPFTEPSLHPPGTHQAPPGFVASLSTCHAQYHARPAQRFLPRPGQGSTLPQQTGR